MAFLHEIGYGKVFSHLSVLYASLAQSLDLGADVAPALAALNRDPIYRAIAAQEFRAPVPPHSSAVTREFESRVRDVRSKADASGTELKPFLSTAEWFLSSSTQSWTDRDYFTVPVIAGSKQAPRAGLVYLRAVPKLRIAPDAGGLDIGDLTSDPRLLSVGKNYFGTIASVLMRTFFMVRTYTFDPDQYLSHHAYRLQFGCQITEGESMGMAVFATFAVAFLRTVLGSGCDSAISPSRGTVLTGAMDADGTVLPVEHVTEKVAACLTEFGPSIRLILPEGSRLPMELEEKINKGNVIYVETAQQLLAAVLCGDRDDHRGFDEARRRVFARLPEDHIREMRKFLSEGVDPDVHRLIAQGSAAWMMPQSRDGGVYVVAKTWRNSFEVRVGLEPSAVEDITSQSANRVLVQVIVDGSEPMDSFWSPDSKTKFCKLTNILYEIASRIDPKREDLVVGFLSHREFHEVPPGALHDWLEALLQSTRKNHKLPLRGPFFMPVYQASVAKYGVRQKRIFVLSDSFLPDWEDDLQASLLTRLRLSPDSSDELLGDEAGPVLLPERGALDVNVLRRYFSRERGTIRSLEIRLGKELPVEWMPANGRLIFEDDCFTLAWQYSDELRAHSFIRMAHHCPASLEFRGVLSRDNGAVQFRFREPCRVAEIGQIETGSTGMLTDQEFELWRVICSPEQECPLCGRSEVHLLEEDPMSFVSKPIFKSLASLRQGWLVLRSEQPRWNFFQTGCQLGEVSLVSVGGVLHWSPARGYLVPVETNGPLYSLTSYAGERIYICSL